MKHSSSSFNAIVNIANDLGVDHLKKVEIVDTIASNTLLNCPLYLKIDHLSYWNYI